MKHSKIGKKFITPLAWDSISPELQPNGKIVECIEDKGNGYLVITTGEKIWVTNEKNLKQII
jgi:hypothetical protein